MARHKDTILTGKAYAIGQQAPMVDVALKEGAQQGPAGPNYAGYISNSRYIKRNIIAILVEAPRGFTYLPNSEDFIAALKAMVELHATTIEGLNSTLTVEFNDTLLGGGGEMLEDVLNVTRERSVPVFTWPEKYGRPIQLILETWIEQLMMDPDTKYPGIISEGNVAITDILPDFNAMTVMFIEPDPTHTKAEKAWLCTNMKPKSAGDNTGRREVGTGGEAVEHAIEFTAITQVGRGVLEWAQELLSEMNLTGMNPNRREAFLDKITEDVKKPDSGYDGQLEEAANNLVS